MMSGSKKILFVSHEYGIGGSTKSLIMLIRGIKELYPDIRCTVIIPMKIGGEKTAKKLLIENNIDNVEFLFRRNYKKIGEGYSLKYLIYDALNYISVIAIKKYISDNKFELICTNSVAVDVGARAAFRIKKAHIQYIREMMEEDYGIECRDKKLMRDVLEKSDGVIFISKFVSSKYLQSYDIRYNTFFYNGFDVQKYYVPNRIIFDKGYIRIAQIGALRDGKGAKESLEIMHLLKKRGFMSFKMIFVGSGAKDYIHEMEHIIEKYDLSGNVKIEGFTNEIVRILKNNDILLMNSVAEGFGRVTVEAMLTGCLVLGRKTGGTTEILSDHRTGILFGDPEEAVDRIIESLKNIEDSRLIAQAGQQFAYDNFDYKKTAANFVQYCKGINPKE